MNCQELAGTYFHGTYNILPADKLPGTWKDILEGTKKCFGFGLIMHQVNHPCNKGLDQTTQVCFIIQSMVENSVSSPTIFWLSMVSDTVFMQASNWLAKCGAISCLSANNFTSCNGKIYVGCCPMANVYSPTWSKKYKAINTNSPVAWAQQSGVFLVAKKTRCGTATGTVHCFWVMTIQLVQQLIPRLCFGWAIFKQSIFINTCISLEKPWQQSIPQYTVASPWIP